MKIGISLDMVNVHHQEPNRNRYESKYYWDEFYPMVVAAGFHAVEIPFDPFWIFRGGSGVPFTKYCVEVKFETVSCFVNHLRSYGIEKVAGIHFSPTIFMRNENLDFYFGASGYFGGEAIRYAAELGCDYITVTPTPPYGLVQHYHGKNENWEADFMERTLQLINHFAQVAKENGIVLSLRNEYWSLFRNQDFQRMISQLDDSIRLNFDSANLCIANQNPTEVLKNNVGKIGSVYLTDTAFIDDNEIWKTPLPEYPHHRATQVFRDLGLGNVNVNEFYETLRSIGYKGWAIVSCRQTREPMRALLRSRNCLNQIIAAGTRP
ncbi:MAG: sugar phosphate isomerase/epimerase [Spirosomataceae bacterium]